MITWPNYDYFLLIFWEYSQIDFSKKRPLDVRGGGGGWGGGGTGLRCWTFLYRRYIDFNTSLNVFNPIHSGLF